MTKDTTYIILLLNHTLQFLFFNIVVKDKSCRVLNREID